MTPEEAVTVCLDEAERQAEFDVLQQIEECLPTTEDESEWNWESLAHFSNSRYNIGVREKDLKQAGRGRVDELLVNKARQSIQKLNIKGADLMLADDYNVRTVSAWVAAKFGLEIDAEEFKEKSVAQAVEIVEKSAIDAYVQREAIYPVMAGFYQFISSGTGGSQGQINREGLSQWASRRFKTEIAVEDFRNKQREDIREMLVAKSRDNQGAANVALEELRTKLSTFDEKGLLPLVNANGQVTELSDWFKSKLDYDLVLDKVETLDRDELEPALEAVVENHYHPEFRRMERLVLLEIVDSGWKDHLLAMDYLRSAVGQRGMAQLDPKVEYKREGMRMFDGLWTSIGERVTDLVFRMEQLNESFVSHTLTETTAIHEDPDQASAPPQQQGDGESQSESRQNAADRAGKKRRVETIRNREKKIGRNDPCSCGSGKKYKTCCLRKQ